MIADTITLLIVLFVVIIFVIAAKPGFDEVNDEIQADSDIDAEAKEPVNDLNTRYPAYFDGLLLFLFVLLWAVTLVSSFMVDTHPIFFAFTLMLMIFVFIIAAILGNAYEDLTGDSTLANEAAEFPIMDWLMTHLLYVAIVVAFSIAIVLFGKNRFGR